MKRNLAEENGGEYLLILLLLREQYCMEGHSRKHRIAAVGVRGTMQLGMVLFWVIFVKKYFHIVTLHKSEYI